MTVGYSVISRNMGSVYLRSSFLLKDLRLFGYDLENNLSHLFLLLNQLVKCWSNHFRPQLCSGFWFYFAVWGFYLTSLLLVGWLYWF